MVVFNLMEQQLRETHQEFFTATSPIIFLIAFFLLVWWALGRYQEKIEGTLRQHLGTSEFIFNNSQKLEKELIFTVETANEYIMTTGSRSRNRKYLEAIEKRLSEPSFHEYWRILYGQEITHELHEHLEHIIDNPKVRVMRLEEDYGYVLVTEDRVILAFPDPEPGVFGTAQVINDKEKARSYKEFVLRLAAAPSAKHVTRDELVNLCLECSRNKSVFQKCMHPS
jgi:hypothetical protein